MTKGLDKLRASEPCDSREGIGKKKASTSKNCKFTDEELLIVLIRVKLSFCGLGLSTHFRATGLSAV